MSHKGTDLAVYIGENSFSSLVFHFVLHFGEWLLKTKGGKKWKKWKKMEKNGKNGKIFLYKI